MGGQGRCEQRSEVFVKIQKKQNSGGGGSGRGGQVDVNEELKFLSFCENSKKIRGRSGRGGGGRVGGGGGSGWM